MVEVGFRAGGYERRWRPIRIAAALIAVLAATVDARAAEDEVAIPPEVRATGAWTMANSLSTARVQSTATTLDGPACRVTTTPIPPWCGKVLVAGGFLGETITLSSAELYDPATGTWSPTAPMHQGRGAHTATLLADGRVLVAGGRPAGYDGTPGLVSAELYDPATGTWSTTDSMADAGGPRLEHTAALLDGPRCRGDGLLSRPAWCGKVLVAGGLSSATSLGVAMTTAALYDPSTAKWAATGTPALPRVSHSMTVVDGGPCRTAALPVKLPYCGRVLVAGGSPTAGVISAGYVEAEFYDPDLGVWVPTGPMTHQRFVHAAVLLDGPACRTAVPAPHCNKVLVSGGATPRQFVNTVFSQPTAELYDPLTGTWAPTGSMLSGWLRHSLTVLDGAPCSGTSPAAHCGKVLASGGPDALLSTTSRAPEMYDPVTGTFVPVRHNVAPTYEKALLVDGPLCRAVAPPPPATCGRVLAYGGPRSATAELFDGSATAQPPTITRVEPVAAPVDGGAEVVVSGAGFRGATEVRFGDVAVDFRVGTTDRILAISPAHAAGAVDVTVTTPVGSSSATDLSRFEFFEASHAWQPIGERVNTVPAPSATTLADGRVLLAGGRAGAFKPSSVVEVFDPLLGRFDVVAPLAAARFEHTATRLRSGEVLVAGGQIGTSWGGCCDSIATAEVFDPATSTWRPTGRLATARAGHTATLLPSGKVLVAGGTVGGLNEAAVATAEIYDPDAVDPVTGARGAWSPAAPMADARWEHHAIAFEDGRVLVVGGMINFARYVGSAEIYDPRADTWTPTGSLNLARRYATATVLSGGRVLVAGGCPAHDVCGSTLQPVPAELYDPDAGTWRSVPGPRLPRYSHTATLIEGSACQDLCGRVMVAGGELWNGRTRSVEVFDPATESWGHAAVLTEAHQSHRTVPLADGRPLVLGAKTAQQLVFRAVAARPSITSVEPPAGPPGTRVRILGTGFSGASRVSFGGTGVVPEVVTPTALVAVAPSHRRGPAPVTVTGPGGSSVNDPTSDEDDFAYSPGRWLKAPSALRAARYLHTSTLLDGPACRAPSPPAWCGKVLVAGGTTNYVVTQFGQTPTPPLRSAELFTPADRTWRRTATDMALPRFGHTATLLDGPACHRPGVTPLHCGKVLVVGGQVNGVGIPDAELYDPGTGSWAPTAAMVQGRFSQTATVLSDGRVLVAGGSADEPRRAGLTSVEIYDPLTGSWSPGPPLRGARNSHTATRLGDGRVLVAGGLTTDTVGGNEQVLAAAELYDPVRAAWTDAAPMAVFRFAHTATHLDGPGCGQLCGQVLVAGGIQQTSPEIRFHESAELFDPVSGAWRPAGSLGEARAGHTATMLPNGTVMVVGGAMTFPEIDLPRPASTAEVYEPAHRRWRFTDQVGVPVGLHAASLLDGPACQGPSPPDHCGSVVISGGVTAGLLPGSTASPLPLDAAGVYTTAPDVASVAPASGMAVGGAEVVITGTNFGGATSVRFGDAATPTFRVDSTTRITATAPASSVVGLVEVVVDGPGGTSALVEPRAGSKFVYVGLPGAISDVVATAVSETEVELRFSTAHAGDGSTPAQDYEIRQFTAAFSSFEAEGSALCEGRCRFSSPAATYMLRVSDLRPGTTYHYGLRALNEQGPGPVRTGVTVTTPGIPPVPVPTCPDVPAAGAASVTYPGGRYSIVGLPQASVVQSSSPLYGWFDLGAGGRYSSQGATAPVTAGRGYWAWFACPHALELSGSTQAKAAEVRFGLGGYRASLVGNPATTPATVSGHDFGAVWDPAANGGAGGYVITGYRQLLTLAVGQGAWVFSYVPTEIAVAGTGRP